MVEDITPGMYPDEIAVAQNAINLQFRTDIPPFLSAYSHPTPLLYLSAAAIERFGPTVIAIRLPSIIFGSLTVLVLYLLLRILIPNHFAITGAILLAFQYSHLVLSRLSYEPTAALFIQMLCIYLIVQYIHTKHTKYLISLGMAVSAGLYTYLNFRLFALFLVIFVLVSIFRDSEKLRIKRAFLFGAAVFIVSVPLLSYALIDPVGFWGRTNEISLFSQGFSFVEIIKELFANLYRSLLLPFMGIPGNEPPLSGDPNPGKNPAGMPFFDPLTTGLAIIGSLYLWRKERVKLLIPLGFFLPALLSDIFSIEIIPDFHYYGLGHPNTLRLSGIIGAIVIVSSIGLWQISTFLKLKKIPFRKTFISTIIAIITFINIFWYFDQAFINRIFYLYNYKVNNADITQTIRYVNSSRTNSLVVTDVLNQHKNYFDVLLKPSIHLEKYSLNSPRDIQIQLENKKTVAIEVNKKTITTINIFLTRMEFRTGQYTMYEVKGILDQPDIIIFEAY